MESSCHECGAIVEMYHTDEDHQLECPRCSAILYRSGQEFTLIIVVALSSLIFFVPSLLLPVLTMNIAGMSQTTSLLQAALVFFSDGYAAIGIVAILTGLTIPAIMLVLIIMILVPIKIGVNPLKVKSVYNLYLHLKTWGMGEVYLVSVFIAIIKLQKMATLNIGLGLYLFTAFLITFYIVIVWFNPNDIWEKNEN